MLDLPSPKVTITIVVTAVTMAMVGYRLLDKQAERSIERYEKLYNRTLITADANKDGITTKDEWIKVYQKLGIHVDKLNLPNPKSLLASQLEKYLANHGIEISDYKDSKIEKTNHEFEEWLNSYNYK